MFSCDQMYLFVFLFFIFGKAGGVDHQELKCQSVSLVLFSSLAGAKTLLRITRCAVREIYRDVMIDKKGG